MWVVATRDMHYDDTLAVRNGQVFRLRNHPNDGLLLKHSMVVALDPQPTEDEAAHLPTCGECGARFQTEWQRDRCGRSHEKPAEVVAERQAKRAAQWVDPNTRAGKILQRAASRVAA